MELGPVPELPPDHLATGAAVLAAIYPDARNSSALSQLRESKGLEPWTVREAWLLNSPQRELNHYVDITATFDRKGVLLSLSRWPRSR